MFIVIKDDHITFSTTIVRGSLIKEQYTKEAFASKHGYILPISMRSLHLIDLLEKPVKTMPEGMAPKGLVITPDRKIEEYTQVNANIARRRILFPGVKLFIRSQEIEVEESISTFYDMKPNGTIAELLEHVRATCSIVLGDYVTLSMDEIQDMIKPHLR